MNKKLHVEINNIKGISSLEIDMPLKPDVYAITGINGIGKSTVLSSIAPRLVRPINFSMLRPFDYTDDSFISFTIDENTEKWQPQTNGRWTCSTSPTLNLRGFQEGSITKGTRFSNTSSYKTYKKLQRVNRHYLLPADDFVRENLGLIVHNNKNYYEKLFRIDRNKAEQIYQYRGVPYFLETNNHLLSHFDLSTGEFLLINLLHLLNNLLVRTNNSEKLNLILIDEIELALHPSAIKRLVEFMKNISHRYNVATYFSTHSLEIIHALPIDNLFYLKQINDDTIVCETPCYPAYITRDIYSHNGYDVIILVEDDLAEYLVNNFIHKINLDENKRIQVLPVGGYDNTLDLHENFITDRILTESSHIISIIDGDVQDIVRKKIDEDKLWSRIPNNNILFLPIESLEKYLKVQLFDMHNYELMRKIRDRLFKFQTEPNWFEAQYRENINTKKKHDAEQNKPIKNDTEYFTNGKNLFSILSDEYVNNGGKKIEFRKAICQLVIDYNDYTSFEQRLGTALQQLFH